MFELKEISEEGDIRIFKTENLSMLKYELSQILNAMEWSKANRRSLNGSKAGMPLANNGDWNDRTYEFTFKTADIIRFEKFIKSLREIK